MFKNQSFKKILVPVSMASLLVLSQLSVSVVAHAAEVPTKTTQSTAKSVSYKNVLTSSSAFLLDQFLNPKFGDEDYVIDLARSGYPVPKNYYNTYYQNLVKELKAKQGVLFDSPSKYARVILAVTAIGKNATNIEGYNLVQAMLDAYLAAEANNTLYDMDNFYMLYALDSKDYAIPAGEKYAKVTRAYLVSQILASQFAEGAFGWDVAWGPDKDGTAMTLTALAPYGKDNSQVKAAIEKAYQYLSNLQGASGGFVGYYNGDSPETVSQLILSLTANHVHPKTDTRFIKGQGNWTISNLLTCYDPATGGFKNAPQATDPNYISSEQSTRALVAYDRFVNGKSSFYDMTDASAKKLVFDTTAPKQISVTSITAKSTIVSGKTEAFATIAIYNGKKKVASAKADVKGNYQMKINKQKSGAKLTVYATDLAKNKSKVKTITVKVK